MSKRIIVFVFLVFFTGYSLLCFSSCNLKEKYKETFDIYGDFLYRIIYLDEDGKEIAKNKGISEFVRIYGLSEEGQQKEVIVVPKTIDGYAVKEIGKNVAFLGWKGDWVNEKLVKVFCLSYMDIEPGSFKNAPNIKKIIVLSSEKNRYKSLWGCNLPVYITGKNYNSSYNNTSYVYDESLMVYFANVSFMWNCDEVENDGYYWIDDYDYGEKIEYIPENPEWDGYTFDGWYKEPECVNRWDFDADTLPKVKYTGDGEEIYQETKLYAKWIKK